MIRPEDPAGDLLLLFWFLAATLFSSYVLLISMRPSSITRFEARLDRAWHIVKRWLGIREKNK